MGNMNQFGLQWHITDKCDQKCKHCYLYAGKGLNKVNEMPYNELLNILENYERFCNKVEKKPFIAVTGGDPLLHNDIWKFLIELKNREIYFSILGNPYHLSYDVAKKLKRLGCTNYQMSLDGLEKTHDFIRKKGSFECTLEKISCLKEAGLRCSIMTTVSKTNIEEIPELVDILVKHKVDNFAFARYCPNSGDYDLLPTPKEYKEFLEKMWNKYDNYKNCDTRFALKDHLWKLFLYEKGLLSIDNIDNSEDLILDGCHCGISHMTVLADGTVYACRRSKTPVGKVPEEELYDIFFSKNMDNYREYEKFQKCSKCELKNFCRGCPSVANCLTGDYYEKDPQCWKEI